MEQRIFGIRREVNGVLQNLVGAEVSFQVFRAPSTKIYLEMTTQDGGIDILDEEECIVRINELQNPGLTAYNYDYKVTVTYADGDVKTYITGKMPIIKLTKRKYDGNCN